MNDEKVIDAVKAERERILKLMANPFLLSSLPPESREGARSAFKVFEVMVTSGQGEVRVDPDGSRYEKVYDFLTYPPEVSGIVDGETFPEFTQENMPAAVQWFNEKTGLNQPLDTKLGNSAIVFDAKLRRCIGVRFPFLTWKKMAE